MIFTDALSGDNLTNSDIVIYSSKKASDKCDESDDKSGDKK